MKLEHQLDRLLAEQLAPFVRRERWQRLLGGWAVIGAVAAVAAVILRVAEQQRGWDARLTWVLLILATAAAALWWRWRIHSAPPDPRRVARLIEQADPQLRALLLTAVAQAPTGPDGQLGYMQEQLVREAVGRVDPARWQAAVPARRLYARGAVAGGGAALVLLCAAGAFAPELPTLFQDGYGLEISPGNTDAEHGTNVLVLARFGRRLPGQVVLVARPAGKPMVRLEMRRTLQDPVWGSLTPALTGEELEYFVEYDGRRSRRHRIRVFRAPEVERLDAKVEYPRQPSLPRRELTDVRHITVLEGARVTVTARLATTAREVRLVSDGERLRLAPTAAAGNRMFWGVVQPPRTQRYEVQVVDSDGRRNLVPPRLTIEVHRNQPAQIRLAFPGRDVRVSPLEEMTVEARFEDDVAVVGHGLSYRLAGHPAREIRLGGASTGSKGNAAAIPGKGASGFTSQGAISLEALGAQPDQLLTYHFWAEDRDADGKLRRSSSDMYFAEVRPFEERFREQSQSGGEEEEGGGEGGPMADLTERQKKIMNATWRLERDSRDGRAAAELHKDAAVVGTSQAELKKAAEGLREQAQDARTRAGLDAATAAMGEARAELQQAERTVNSVQLGALVRALDAEQRAFAGLLRLRDRERQVTRGNSRGGGGGEAQNPELSGLELKQKESRYETRKEASTKPPSARPERQALARLDELARRQEALSARLREAEAAREDRGGDEAERERRLKSLREEQQELMQDLDELARKLEAAGQTEAARRTRAELEATRREAAAVSEALARGETGKALGASTRAQRELERMRKDLAKDVAAGFEDEMRELRDQASKLDEAQRAIGESLARKAAAASGPDGAFDNGGSPTEARRLASSARAQKQEAEQLLQRVQKVSDEAEATSPMLSRKLYDGLREAKLADVERALEGTAELLDRNLGAEAQPLEERARKGIGGLRAQVDEAARGVLGDPERALRQAQAELEALLAQAAQEAQTEGQGQQRGQGQQPGQGQGQQPAQGGQGQGQRQGQQPGQAQGPGQGQQPGPGRGQTGGETPTPGGGQGQGQGGGQERGQASGPDQGDGTRDGGNEGPISGSGFRAFNDRLRDLEDLLDDPRQRQSAAEVRDRARALRAEWKYHSKRPQPAVLEKQILAPLTELRRRLGEELTRLERNERLVPLDRDPVPGRYSDVVRRYWKSLSQGR